MAASAALSAVGGGGNPGNAWPKLITSFPPARNDAARALRRSILGTAMSSVRLGNRIGVCLAMDGLVVTIEASDHLDDIINLIVVDFNIHGQRADFTT